MGHPQDRLALKQWLWCGLLVLSTTMMAPPGLLAQQPIGEKLVLALRNNVVNIVAERPDGQYNGFGFIVGERDGLLFIVTANHVVRGNTPGDVSKRLTIRFFHDQGRTYQATLLETSDPGYDLAVLQAKSPQGLVWQRPSLGPRLAERGTPVWFVGRFGEWFVPVEPGRVNKVTLDYRLAVENLRVQVGTSGAPLIAENGIIGMVVSDAPGEDLRAISIDIIQRAFENWNLPWNLTPMPPSPPPSPQMSRGQEFYRSLKATEKAEFARGRYVLFFNPEKWKRQKSEETERLTWNHRNGDGYAQVISERIQIPLENLRKLALDNMKGVDPNAKITFEEKRQVNGREVLCLQMKMTSQGVTFVFFGYYYSGKGGIIQIVTYTGENLFEEYQNEFEEFLNGFEVVG